MEQLTIRVNEEVRLEPICRVYLQDIFENFTIQVVRYLPLLRPSEDINDTRIFIDKAMADNTANTNYTWVVLKDEAFIGCCSVRDISSGVGDFGYWIKEDQQGRSIGMAVAKSVIDWSFANGLIHKMKYPVDKRNIPSVKIIEKLGGRIVKSYITGQENCLEVDEYHIDRSSW